MGPDISALSTSFGKWGGQVIREKINEWDLQNDVFIHRGVTSAHKLPKLKAQGKPRPYRAADDFTGNDPKFTDREITARQSKWDFELDYEKLRQTYLSEVKNGRLNPGTTPLHQYIMEHYAKSYLSTLYNDTVYLGDYDAAGSDAVDIATGFGTIIAAEITATNLAAIATGAISNTNAVTKAEQMGDSLPFWLQNMGFKLLVSHSVFGKYMEHYRTLNPFGFAKNDGQSVKMDRFKGTITAKGWMGTSQRIIAVPDVPTGSFENPLHMATNDDAIEVFATPHLNIMQVRLMYPVGFEISDLGAIFVNNQA